MWGDGGGGSPGQLGLPAGLGRKGQLVGEASTGNAGAAEPPPSPRRPGLRSPWPSSARSRLLRGTGRGSGGEDGAAGGGECDPRPLRAPAREAGRSLCFQSSLLFLFLDNCFSQTSKK